MDEFKLQFSPKRLIGGSERINEKFERKHYSAVIVQGRRVVHTSKVQFKRSTDAIGYARRVVRRYKNMAMIAFTIFMESQDVQPTN